MNGRRLADAAWLGGWLLLIAAVLGLPFLTGDPGNESIRWTIRLCLALWASAAAVMLRLPADAWRRVDLPGPGHAARWLWSLAWGTFVVHVLVAMHYYHHWSHAHAIEHTRQASGWGEGIYVSHVFNVLWGLDVLWWQLAPASYAARSPQLGLALHAFMAFIIFNGTVVYEQGAIRWAGLAGFAVLAWIAWQQWAARRREALAP